MTDVQMPDGTIARFPDNMSDDQITAALKSQSTPQMEGAARAPALYGSALAKGGLQGLGAIGDLQGLLQRYAVDPVADYAAGLMGLKPGAPTPPPRLGSGNLVTAGRELGLVDRPDLQPQNSTERYGSAAAEGVGSMLPYAVGGGAARLIPNLVRTTIQGGAGGAAGEAGADLLTNNQTLGDHPVLGRIAGNVLGTLAGGGAFNTLNKSAGYATGATSPTVDAYRRLNIDPTLAGDVTGNPFLQSMQAMASKFPGGTGTVLKASEKASDQWGRALDATAGNLGKAQTLDEAGSALQTGGKDWLKQWNADGRTAWNNVKMHIPENTPAGVTNYATTLNDVRSQLPNAPATAGVLQSNETRALLDALIKDTRTGPLTWKDVSGIRTRIGERLGDPQLVGETGYADLKRLYGALSRDLEAVAATRGPSAQQAFTDASALTKDGHDFIEGTLSRIVKGDKIAPGDAAKNMLGTAGTGGTTLQEIRDRMPSAADELAAYKLREMGLARSGQQNASGTQLSPGRFLTDRNKMSPEAASALFDDPYTTSRIADLSHVAGTMKATEKFLNFSNTAPAQQLAGVFSDATRFIPGYVGGKLTTSPMLTGLLAARPAAETSGPLLNRAAILPPILRGLLDV